MCVSVILNTMFPRAYHCIVMTDALGHMMYS